MPDGIHHRGWFVALGILSAPQYQRRRDELRRTWLSSPLAARGGEFLCRFVVAWPDVSVATHGERVPPGTASAELEAERERHGDMLVFASRATGRVWGPVVSTYLWFTHAARMLAHAPRAAFVGKLDDDVYVGLGTLLAQLRLVRTQLGASAHVYYGAMYWTMYDAEHYEFHGSRYTYFQVASGGVVRQTCAGARPVRRPNGSRPLAQCVGPFPFTTGSLQIVSAGLLELIASSVGAAAHIARAVELANTRSAEGSLRRAPAYEDVWLGYAVRALLPTDTQVHVVHLDKQAYYHDTWGLKLASSTFLYHNRLKTPSRIEAVASFSGKYHCEGAPAVLGCAEPWRAASRRTDKRALDRARARAGGPGRVPPLQTTRGAHSVGNASVIYRECQLYPVPARNLSGVEGVPRCATQPVVTHDLKRTCQWPGRRDPTVKVAVCS